MNYKNIIKLGIYLIASLILTLYGIYTYKLMNNNTVKEILIPNKEINTIPDNNIKTIKITAVGDCTIGWDSRYSYEGRYDYYLKQNNNDYGYYLSKVKDIFTNDDLTIINLEGDLTNSTEKREKKFNFSAPPEYIKVLTEANVDIVSFANNHTHDFGEQGYQETIDTLNSINMPYYGYTKYLIKEVNGIKIGFFGLLDIYGERYNEVDKAIKYLKEQNCDLIIASMHWGIEYDYEQSKEQIKMGHYLIDNGVDLVIGHHPHVLQGIEKYNNKYIIYSLGNFTFGGNQNPSDKDTLIYQQTFSFKNDKLELDDNINLIPASISSVKNINNYQPILLESNEKQRVLEKIMKYSSGFTYQNI